MSESMPPDNNAQIDEADLIGARDDVTQRLEWHDIPTGREQHIYERPIYFTDKVKKLVGAVAAKALVLVERLHK